ncbi:GntR family transcriptional regulator [Arthrobacter rhombi]|uniref:GntR family transcriptional regulator n=1 Tax=Arthrobacter rhombi TaxID=71253 RepID=UPI0031D1CE8D
MISVDADDPSGPSEQIRVQFTALIRSGVLPADAKLPPVRQLAGDLRLAPGTVAKSYRELEAQGLVITGRAAGTRVAAGQALPASILEQSRQFAQAARDAGLAVAEAQGLVALGWE